MPLRYILIKNSKIAPFKYGHNLPYGSFINTTKTGDYPVKQTISINDSFFNFVWPSTEHAFHAQKIIHLMRKKQGDANIQNILMSTLRKIESTKNHPGEAFLPRNDWDPIVTDLTKKHPSLFGVDKVAFDALCDSNYHIRYNPSRGLMSTGEPYTLKFMRDVVKLKLEQYPLLKQLAIDCAREGILPIEVSQYDFNWASGPDGTGTNMLGIVILELGNEFLKEKEPHTPLKIPNPKIYYQQVQVKIQQQLSHHSLVSYTRSMGAWTQSTGSLTKSGQGIRKSEVNEKQPQIQLEANGSTPYGDRFFIDKNTLITLVLRADGGHHFSKDKKGHQVDKQYGQAMLAAYHQLENEVKEKQQQIQLEVNGSKLNGDRFFIDKKTGITLVMRKNGCFHFSKNKNLHPVDKPYEQAMLAAYRQLENEIKEKQRRIQLEVNGSKPNGDRYFIDRKTDITLVLRADGDHHFSKDKKAHSVDKLYEQAMLAAYRQLENEIKVKQQRIQLEVNGSKPNGDRYFIDRKTDITLVIRADGGHHFSKDKNDYKAPKLYEQAMLAAYQQLVNLEPQQRILIKEEETVIARYVVKITNFAVSFSDANSSAEVSSKSKALLENLKKISLDEALSKALNTQGIDKKHSETLNSAMNQKVAEIDSAEKAQLLKLKEARINAILLPIDAALAELIRRVGEVNRDQFRDADEVALTLVINLTSARNQYEENMKVRDLFSGQVFKNTCKDAINDAMPVLQNALGWGDYLTNLLKILSNAVIKVVTLGHMNNFFTPVQSDLENAVRIAERDLEGSVAKTNHSL
ncbi:hypothetical protein [Legionella sainthelensi]|uniref:hypothetical protein n=1 Tax=Legionella sainthelensi TaxID=28087 RepID=UPI000E202735|nr:hypothetical protein [Legionella sainthelensi]